MEETMLKKFEYKVTIASAQTFLARGLKAGHADKKLFNCHATSLKVLCRVTTCFNIFPATLQLQQCLLHVELWGDVDGARFCSSISTTPRKKSFLLLVTS